MSRARKDTTAGFSLVEILVAIVILGFGLVGMTQAITTTLGASQDAEHHTTAVMLRRCA